MNGSSSLRMSDVLEQHFDTAFAAPEGVKKLRELILTLAMQGKLVPQDSADPPASLLLKEIEAEKKRLVKAGKIKKPRPLPPLTPEEMPYALPKGWEWVRLGSIGIINPRNDAEDSKMAGFVPMALISEGYSMTHQFETRLWREIKKGYTHFASGDVGMAKITPCFENAKSCVFSNLPNDIGAGTTELHIFRNTFNAIVPKFLLYCLKNPHFIAQSVPYMTGSAGQKRVPTTYFAEQIVPFPPLPEQNRIVSKIDQMMAWCDDMETLRAQRERMRIDVHAAAVKKLLDAAASPGFPQKRESSGSDKPAPGLIGNDLKGRDEKGGMADAWRFLSEHFADLYTLKATVADLRKTILQLAVMGKLVPQDPADPPASELLKEIEAKKKRLVKEGKIKKPKPLPPVKPEEMPYGLPQGWEWVRLGNSMLKITDGTHHSPPNNDRGDFLYISAKNIKDDGVTIHNATYITKKIHEEIYSRCDPEYGNILFIKDGATTGIVTINDLKKPFSMLSSVALIKQPLQVSNRYLLFVMRSPYFYKEMRAGMTGVAITRVTLKKLQDALIPLPPVPEQHRIVAKIDQLMALCDTLEQKIDAADGKQTALLDAVIARI